MTQCDFTSKTCKPCEGGVDPLGLDEAKQALTDHQLEGWQLAEDGKMIFASFDFDNYYQTMAFVNAVAFMAHREDHHPDLAVGYSKVVIYYQTHAIGGLSENDLICAAKVNRLIRA